jgi:hypothetical protein
VLLSNPFCEPLAVAIAKVIVPLVVTGVAPMVTPLVAEDKPTDVTVPVLLVLLLKVVQSAELNAPLFAALAVGMFNVITGVVVPLATLELTSVPVVPNVRAATDVTVPTLNVLSALKSWAVPLIVIDLVVGTPPNPLRVYVGTFKTPVVLLYVAAPLAPDTVKLIAALAKASVYCVIVDATVNEGYVPDTLMPLPAVMLTVWSGDELVITPVVLLYEMPVPALNAALALASVKYN